MNDIDTAAAYEMLAAYPVDVLRAEREDLIKGIAGALHAEALVTDACAAFSVGFEIDAMVLIRDEVARLGVKGHAGIVLAGRAVLSSFDA